MELTVVGGVAEFWVVKEILPEFAILPATSLILEKLNSYSVENSNKLSGLNVISKVFSLYEIEPVIISFVAFFLNIMLSELIEELKRASEKVNVIDCAFETLMALFSGIVFDSFGVVKESVFDTVGVISEVIV